MNDKRQSTGKWGEDIAKKHLIDKGYQVVAQNWRNRFGEIDLVMLDQEMIVIVEVRTRTTNTFGSSIESITYKKQVQLTKMANILLQSFGWWERPVRFDAVVIDGNIFKFQVEHLKNIIN